ncbi:MAG: FkbM family methyltransferase [Candidatus Saccharibacteria bacterium]|nr:FkbM family methyltransferase [Moraxellaceae bacterium]
MIKNSIRKKIRQIGWDLHRLNPSGDPGTQIVAALNHARVNTVFDIGANAGQFAKEIRELGFAGKIVSFEPLTSARKKLSPLAARDRDWIVHDQCALGDHDGEIEINISGNSVSSSVLPMLESHCNAAMGSAYVGSERIPIFMLDNIANRYLQESSNLFIKIDTQGYEWQVLDGASESLKRARGLLCELSLVPLYHGQRLWRDIVDRLEQEGFMLWALQKGFTDPRTGQSLQMDGIFLRRDVFLN